MNSNSTKFSTADFVRKDFNRLRNILSLAVFFRHIKAWYYFKNYSIQLGRHVRIFGLPINIKTGRDIVFYDNVVFEFGSESFFSIGDHSVLSYGVILSCRENITIGSDVQVGEYTSIRDSTHDHRDTGKPMRINKDIRAAISIGNNVWIGRGCIIMPGTVIEDGVVIGANSVVKGVLKKDGIYAGSPCQFIKSRV